MREAHEEATRLLDAHRDELEALVHALMERGTLDEEDILEVTGLARAPDLDGTVARSDGRAG